MDPVLKPLKHYFLPRFTCVLFFKLLKAVLIKMRRGKNHLFKGSVFVEFSTVDEAKAFVATEALKYNEQELIKMMK